MHTEKLVLSLAAVLLLFVLPEFRREALLWRERAAAIAGGVRRAPPEPEADGFTPDEPTRV